MTKKGTRMNKGTNGHYAGKPKAVSCKVASHLQ